MSDFWARVDRGPNCWEWQGSRNHAGYGLRGGSVATERRAHREAFRLAYGEIPPGMVVMHTCDNPPCCRPAHLRLGTQADNLRDARSKGHARLPNLRGSDIRTSKLTEQQVREIRARKRDGERSVALAAEYGISPQNVWIVSTGRGWTHIEGAQE